MAGNPRTVAVDTTIFWDGVSQRLPRGQLLDVTPGGALEAAIGRDRLVPLRGAIAPPPAMEAASQEEPKAPAPKPRAAAKTGDGKDGEP
jgi:hypothetical protein